MIRLLGYEEAELRRAQGLWTAREIAQQPESLRATQQVLTAGRPALEPFLSPILTNRRARVILTGAGSSAFIGQMQAPLLDSILPCRVEAIATTDLVAAPRLYLDYDTPTLLVSFARSGNSPESIASVDLANQLVGDVRHLCITCNADGGLARWARTAGQGQLVLLPEQTHDRGFAMTSSLTAMLLAGLSAIGGNDRLERRIEAIAAMVERVLAEQVDAARELSAAGFSRVVYLGSGPLAGLAREAALKLLELTDGTVVALHDTPLGFRHGPKTVVDQDTLVLVFLSSDPYTRSYDLDLIAEIRRDGRANRVVALSGQSDASLVPSDIVIPAGPGADDADLLFPYLAFAQVLAFHHSLSRGLAPDNPNRTGVVNRVVQGVTIHPFRGEAARL